MDTKQFLTTDRLSRVASSVENFFRNSAVKSYHHHTLRVAQYAAGIADAESVAPEPVIAAALVHDVGMVLDPSFMGHVQQTAKIAPLILLDCGFSTQEADRIAQVAASHHPAPTEQLDDINKQILFDADNLEIVGIFGFLRWFGGIPSEAEELVSSANLFLSIIDNSLKSRGSYFYTNHARYIGDEPLSESIRLCKELTMFIQESTNGHYTLKPTSFLSALNKNLDS
ncbi:MAG: HD domain-containing protein [Pseudomonadota bacterium]